MRRQSRAKTGLTKAVSAPLADPGGRGGMHRVDDSLNGIDSQHAQELLQAMPNFRHMQTMAGTATPNHKKGLETI